MDFSTLASQNTKLIETFEKSTAPAGADLKSDGPLAPPDASLVKEFDAAMQAPAEATDMQSMQTNSIDGTKTSAQEIDQINGLNNENKNNVDHTVKELQTAVEALGQGQMSPEQLLRIQYLSGILKVSVESGNKIIQSASQGVDSMLKQQG